MNIASVAKQSALETIQIVARSILQTDPLYGRGRGRRSKFSHSVEILRQDLIKKGDLLLEAMRQEHDFESSANESDRIAKDWRECRRAVERLAEDYNAALDLWRETVTAAASDPQALKRAKNRVVWYTPGRDTTLCSPCATS